SPVNPSIPRRVVIRVAKVASFGNGSVSSSPQAEDPCKFGSDLGAKENRRVVNDRTIRLIHRDFMFLTSGGFVRAELLASGSFASYPLWSTGNGRNRRVVTESASSPWMARAV